MFLETIKSLLTRHKERRRLAKEHGVQPPQNSLRLAGCSTTEAQLPLQALPLPSVTSFDPNATSNLQEPSNQPSDPSGSPSNGFFANSHGFVVNQPTMVSNVFNSGGGAVMRLLAEKRIPGAEVDSSARYPPPRCHPETRQDLREQITHWIVDPGRRWRMLYVLGAAGVGKSALAQTIAEDRKEAGCLGATCFLSRPNHRNDPNGVIPTLVHQLAVKLPIYKHIISQKLADDPTILEKDRKTQFKELIVDPFRTIMTRQASTLKTPLLIIIDGLDECEGEEAQCEFIELISDHVRSVSQFPLLWMICSRPEWHLRYLLMQPDFQVTCKRVEISVDDDEAQRDVSIYLRAEFTKIRLRHQDSLDDDWPHEIHFRRITAAASGLFAFASTIARFVGDTNAGDPSENLQTCIRMLGGSSTPGPLNPYHALDLLYRQILMSIPSGIRPTTMRILGTLLLYSPRYFTPFIRPMEYSPPSFNPPLPYVPLPPIVSPPSPMPVIEPQAVFVPSPPFSPAAPKHYLSESPTVMPEVLPRFSPTPMPSLYYEHHSYRARRPNFITSSAKIQANFLRITKSTFYHALKQLYLVLRIPSSSDASTDSITFYHASFGDFLRDQIRSGEFCIGAAAVHYDVAINALHWYTDSVEKQHQDVTWVSSCEDRKACLETLRSCSLSIMWKACAGADGDNASMLVKELQSFDFNVLGHSIPDQWDFPKFLVWLHSMRQSVPARKLINVPEECVLCTEVGSTRCDFDSDASIFLTRLGLETFNGSEGEVHCFIGNGSRRRHIQIIDPIEITVEPPSRPDSPYIGVPPDVGKPKSA